MRQAGRLRLLFLPLTLIRARGTAVAFYDSEEESGLAFLSQHLGVWVMDERNYLDVCVKIDAVKTDFSLPPQTTIGDIALLVTAFAAQVGAPVQEVTVTPR